MFYVFLVGLSKATFRCYTSICDGIIFLLLLQFGYWISFNLNSTSIVMLKVTWKTGDAYIGMRSSPASSSTNTTSSITDAREDR